ncbi:hypothetical protein WMC41_16010 [Shinella yambaruensis]|uniref:hypothetical protein n=1 Tax=Shinella yambaruensis TaxID=415996 RepID=UPI003D7B7C59
MASLPLECLQAYLGARVGLLAQNAISHAAAYQDMTKESEINLPYYISFKNGCAFRKLPELTNKIFRI